MRKYAFSLIIGIYTYLLALSVGHSYYLMKINDELETTISNLVEQIAHIQSNRAWHEVTMDNNATQEK